MTSWKAKEILIDLRHSTGDCGHGTCGTGMIVTNVSEMIGPPASSEGEADGGQVRLILKSNQTITMRLGGAYVIPP